LQSPVSLHPHLTHQKGTTTVKRLFALLLFLSIALGLTACATGSSDSELAAACEEMSGWPTSTEALALVIVVDHTASTRESELDAATVAEIARTAGLYGSVSVLLAEGAGGTPRWLVDGLATNAAENAYGTPHYEEAVQRAATCVERLIGDPVPAQPGSDLGTAIQVAAERLGEYTGPRSLVVQSDGFANVSPIDLTGVIARTGVDTAIQRLDAVGFRPDLSNTDVRFTGLGVSSAGVTSGPALTWLRNFYVAVCERAQAVSCAAPISDQGAAATGTAAWAGAPEDADLELPATQFEFDESEVRFQPGSTVLDAAADAALSEVAACLTDGSTLTVIGHAASTNDPAREQEVADGRARVVAQRIVELAGHPDVTVTAFGVGATEPKTATGDQPEDRRVAIALTGVCG
jgi:outer membrane protein OmpA-like peptidoglycan-associated protein